MTRSQQITYPLAPTAILPALVTLHACDETRVGNALRALRDLYFPHASLPPRIRTVPALREPLSDAVRTFRPRFLDHHDSVPDSGYASAEEGDRDDDEKDKKIDEQDIRLIEEEVEVLDLLRSDELERGYAIKWLTGLVKRGDAWVCEPLSSEVQDARMRHLEDASRLLARFASGDVPEEALTRTFVFPFTSRVLPSSLPITVELNDAPVDGTDHAAVGLQSWGSAIIFAERMCLDPERYLGMLGPCTSATVATQDAATRHLLELGAGTGLLSITAAQIFSRASVRSEIKATDYHPSVLDNLACNVSHNPTTGAAQVCVLVEKLDWWEVSRGCTKGVGAGTGTYDVVLAADVVYYPEHADWIRGCVERTMNEYGVFWLIIPMRTTGRHAGLGERVEEVFPAVNGSRKREGPEGGSEEIKGRKRLAIVGKEEIRKMDGVGRADEVGYILFEVRWA